MMVQSMIMMVLRQPNAINPKMASVAREYNLKSYDQELSLRAPLPHFFGPIRPPTNPLLCHTVMLARLELSSIVSIMGLSALSTHYHL